MNLPKISFSDAAVTLSNLCNRMDEEEDIDELLVQEFNDALTNVSESVDRRKAVFRELESKIEMARSYKNEIKKQIERYEILKERLVETTKRIILAHPNIPFKDSFGRQLKVLPNPTPKLVLDQYMIESMSPYEDMEYLKYDTVVQVDKEAIKKDLLNGKKLSWARLEYGTQLRGLK